MTDFLVHYKPHCAPSSADESQSDATSLFPIGARLFSIVDAVDAISCDRPYRQARSFQAAFQALEKGKGAQFDPPLVELFVSLPEEKLLSIRDRLPDTE